MMSFVLPEGLAFKDLLIAVFVILLSVARWYHQRSKKKYNEQPALKHSRHAKVARLRVYPIKSCAGLDLTESHYEREGFDYDRKWMIVDIEKNKQLSARDDRGVKLVRVFPEIIDDSTSPCGRVLRVAFPDEPGHPSFDVPLDPSDDQCASWEICSGFDLWGTPNEGFVVPALSRSDTNDKRSPSEVFSDYVGKPVKFVMKTPSPRTLAPMLEFDRESLQYDGGSMVRYPDVSPFLLASVASIDDAEKRVRNHPSADDRWRDEGSRLLIERFRPNIIVDGVTQPFGEDDWIEATIAEDRFALPNRCPRCMFPNVDTETGVRHRAMPNNAMMKYRKVDSMAPAKYCFGMYTVPFAKQGRLRVGDKVTITRSAPNPKING